MKSRALTLAALALLVSLCGWSGGGVRSAAAQALDAGKPPAQIFAGTCSACHRSPRGLVRSVAPGSLPGFLRQHYTTGSDMAGTMAAYVLGSGGTDRVAEPSPKQEQKQRAKSDASDVAARTPDQKELSKSAKQKAAKKGQPEPAKPAKDAEEEKAEPAKTEQPAPEPSKAETAAVECKIEEPTKQAAATADDSKPGFALPTPAATPPRQPTSLLTLPGFPAPVPEPEPEPVATTAAPSSPPCDPPANGTATASTTRAEAQKEQPNEQPKEQPKEQVVEPPPAATPAAVAEAPKTEPPRPAVTEAITPPLDIMQEEVHVPRPARTGQQKKRAPAP